MLAALPLCDMAHDWLTLDDLARQLGRDRRELEKLVNRGRLPGRKRDGFWHFHEADVSQWLEGELRTLTDSELAAVEARQESDDSDPSTPVTSLLKPELCEVPLAGRTKRGVLESLVEVAGRTWQVWEPATVLKAILQRDEMCSTALDGGVAIPHPREPLVNALGEPVVAFGRAGGRGVPFGAPDGRLTDLFFLVLCRDTQTHLRVLARLARMLQQKDFAANLRAVETAAEAHDLITQTEAAVG